MINWISSELKNLCLLKDTIKINRQATDLRKYSEYLYQIQDFYPVYVKNSYYLRKKYSTPQQKWAEHLNRHL